MNVKRIFSLVIVLSVALAASMVAPRQAAADVVPLTVWFHEYGQNGTTQALQQWAADYSTANPGVKVTVNIIPGDYEGAKLPAALLTDAAPDVFEYSRGIANLVEAGQLAPLDDLYTADIKKDFGSTLDYSTFNGHVYGVPMILDTTVNYYRKSVFTAAGVKPPTTMDEFNALAAKLTTKKMKGLYIGNDGVGVSPILSMWAAGGDYFDKNGKVAFNTPDVASAWGKIVDLNKSDSLLLGAPAEWWDTSALTDGQVAIQHSGLWALPDVQKAFGDDFGVFPWPALDAQHKPSMLVGEWVDYANAKGKHVKEAKDFIKWLWIENTKAQQQWTTGFGAHLPARASVAAGTDLFKSGAGAEILKFVQDYGHPQRIPMWSSAMETGIGDALVNIIKNKTDVTAGLQAFADTTQKEYDALAAGNTAAATAAATMAK